MYVPVHHPGSFRSPNSSHANGRDDHDPYSQRRCQLCEERSTILHNLRIPGHNPPLQVCRPCYDEAQCTQQQRGYPSNINRPTSGPCADHTRSRSWIQRAFGRNLASSSQQSSSGETNPNTRPFSQAEINASTQAQTTAVARSDSEETLAAAGRGSYPEQLRNIRARARGQVDDVQGNLSGVTLVERRGQRARREAVGRRLVNRGGGMLVNFFFMAL